MLVPMARGKQNKGDQGTWLAMPPPLHSPRFRFEVGENQLKSEELQVLRSDTRVSRCALASCPVLLYGGRVICPQ